MLRGEDAGGALWVSRAGRRLGKAAASAAFRRVTLAVQGRTANPQAFRHSAVTELLNADPKAMETASALLAHGDVATTSRFYDLSADDAARMQWRKISEKYRAARRS